MIQISLAQWETLGAGAAARLRRRLVEFLESHFGPTDPTSPYKTPDEAVTAALEFQQHAWEMTELQLARLAILLVTINRCEVPAEGIEAVRALLLQAGRSGDERLDAAADYLGLPR